MTIADFEVKKISHMIEGKLLIGEQLAKYFIGHVLNEMVYPIVGLKRDNYPTGELAKMIANHIIKYYGYITPVEIYTSFELALQGKYLTDILDRNPLEHFQTMDLKYINDVLRAYVRYRHTEVENTRNKVAVLQRDYHAETLANMGKCDVAIKTCIKMAYDEFLKDRKSESWYLTSACFDFLVDVGKIRYYQKWLNKRYSVICSRDPRMKKSEAKRMTRNMAIYKWFSTQVNKQDRFAWMQHVCYISPDMHQTLQLIIHAKSSRNLSEHTAGDQADLQD